MHSINNSTYDDKKYHLAEGAIDRLLKVIPNKNKAKTLNNCLTFLTVLYAKTKDQQHKPNYTGWNEVFSGWWRRRDNRDTNSANIGTLNIGDFSSYLKQADLIEIDNIFRPTRGLIKGKSLSYRLKDYTSTTFKEHTFEEIKSILKKISPKTTPKNLLTNWIQYEMNKDMLPPEIGEIIPMLNEHYSKLSISGNWDFRLETDYQRKKLYKEIDEDLTLEQYIASAKPAIEAVLKGEPNASFPDRKGKRFYHSFASLKRSIRELVRYDGKPLVEVDVKSCHVALLACLYELDNDTTNKEKTRFISDVTSGDIYVQLGLKMNKDRQTTKKELLSYINGDYGFQYTDVAKAFGELYSILGSKVNFHKKYKNNTDNKTLWRTLCNLEAEVIINDVFVNGLKDGIMMLPIHDALVCLPEAVEAVKTRIEQAFIRKMGFSPKLEVKSVTRGFKLEELLQKEETEKTDKEVVVHAKPQNTTKNNNPYTYIIADEGSYAYPSFMRNRFYMDEEEEEEEEEEEIDSFLDDLAKRYRF